MMSRIFLKKFAFSSERLDSLGNKKPQSSLSSRADKNETF